MVECLEFLLQTQTFSYQMYLEKHNLNSKAGLSKIFTGYLFTDVLRICLMVLIG